MKHNHTKKRGHMALKLDMSKAYDHIEWDYLACIMIRMGFPAVWIDHVMKCVSIVKYDFSQISLPLNEVLGKAIPYIPTFSSYVQKV